MKRISFCLVDNNNNKKNFSLDLRFLHTNIPFQCVNVVNLMVVEAKNTVEFSQEYWQV